MNIFLIIAIALLLLLLTGNFVGVTVMGLKIAGWIAVIALCAALLWRLISVPLAPISMWVEKHKELRRIKDEIKRRNRLGYETYDLETQIKEVKEKYDKDYQAVKEKRHSLGYDE